MVSDLHHGFRSWYRALLTWQCSIWFGLLLVIISLLQLHDGYIFLFKAGLDGALLPRSPLQQPLQSVWQLLFKVSYFAPWSGKIFRKKKKRESSLKVYFNDQTLKHVSNGGGNANTAPLTGRWCLLMQSCGVSKGTVRGGNVHREQTHTDDGGGASLISGLSSNQAKAEGEQVSITWEVEARHAAS